MVRGNGAEINAEGGLVETSGFSPSQHPWGIGDADTEREGLPDTAGVPRATEEAVGLQRRRKEGWKEGDDSGKKHETDEEWSADVREV